MASLLIFHHILVNFLHACKNSIVEKFMQEISCVDSISKENKKIFEHF